MMKYLFTLGLLLLGAVSLYAPVEAQTPPTEVTRFDLPSDAVELIMSRARDRKVFRLTDGQVAMVFQENLHYQRSDGIWTEPILQFGALRTAEISAFAVDTDMVVIAPKGKGITWKLPQRPQKVDGDLVYQDRGIAWTYKKLNGGVKLEGVVTALRGLQTYTFPYRTALPLAIERGGAIAGDGFTILPPLIIDANGTTLRPNWVIGNGELQVTFDDAGLVLPYTIDPTTVFTVTGGNDGSASGTSGSYPPSCASAGPTNGTFTGAQKDFSSFSGGTYTIQVGLFTWDTSSIPDTAVVDSATFGYTLSSSADDNSRNFVAEYYTVGTIDCGDFTDTVGTDAINVDLTGIANPITLSNVGSISLTGLTGLRTGISGGAPPSSDNFNNLQVEDASFGTGATLNVTYTEMVVTSVAPSEVAANGTKSFTITGDVLTGVTSVRLEKTAESNINCTSVVVVSDESVTMDCGLTSAADGLWDVVAVKAAGSATGSAILDINVLALTASTPTSALPTGSAVLTLTGDGFDTGAQVTLERSGESDIVCTGESVASFISMTASCDLTGVASGFWDVVVTNTDTTAATLTNGLFVSSIITLQATGLTSGAQTLRIVGDATGVFLYIDDVLQDSHGTQAVVIDNANDYQMFSNSAMPYVEFAKISVEGVLQLHYEFNDLPDHELTDRSGEGHSATARYPDTIDGYTTALQAAEGSAVGGAVVVEPGPEIIGAFDVIDDQGTTNTAPGSGFFGFDVLNIFTSAIFPFQALTGMASVAVVLTGMVISARFGFNHTLGISFVMVSLLAIMWRMGGLPFWFTSLMVIPILVFLMWKRFNP